MKCLQLLQVWHIPGFLDLAALCPLLDDEMFFSESFARQTRDACSALSPAGGASTEEPGCFSWFLGTLNRVLKRLFWEAWAGVEVHPRKKM